MHIQFPLHQMFHGDFGAGITLMFQPRASDVSHSLLLLGWKMRSRALSYAGCSQGRFPREFSPSAAFPGGWTVRGPSRTPRHGGVQRGEARGCLCGAVCRLGKRFPTLCPVLSASGARWESHPSAVRTPGGQHPGSPGKTLLNLSDAKLCIISGQSRHRPPGIFGADIPGGKKECIYKESAGELNQSS